MSENLGPTAIWEIPVDQVEAFLGIEISGIDMKKLKLMGNDYFYRGEIMTLQKGHTAVEITADSKITYSMFELAAIGFFNAS